VRVTELLEKLPYVFILKFAIIYFSFYLLALYIVDDYIKLSGISLFWTCSTIIQGLGALLALIGMFLIYQFQIIDTLIIETHKRAEYFGDLKLRHNPKEEKYKAYEKLIKAYMEDLDDYETKKKRLKEIFIRPLALMVVSLVLSFIALPFGEFNFKPNVLFEESYFISISAYLLPLIVISIWAIFSLILAIAEIIKGRIKWSYFRPT